MSPDELVLVSEAGCDRPRLGIVVMSRLPDKTLVDFGDVIATCENKRLCREKPNRRRG